MHDIINPMVPLTTDHNIDQKDCKTLYFGWVYMYLLAMY